MTQPRRENEPAATWLGHHDFGSARWVAWALVLFFYAGAVGSAWMSVVAEAPIAGAGFGVLCLSAGTLMLPPALLGRRRSAGVKLGCACLFLFGVAFAALSFAGRVEPEFFEDGRGPFLRVVSPGMALVCFVLSALLLRKILRQRH